MRPIKPTKLVYISIGYQGFLIPADAGMKAIALMQNAVECRRHYEEGGYEYHVEGQPEITLELVKDSAVRWPEGAVPRPPARPVKLLTKA